MLPLDLAMLVARFIIGTFFISQGYKILSDPKDMAKWLGILGYKPGVFWTWVLIITEFFGGICILIGFGTRFFALLLTIIMLLGIYHRKYIGSLNMFDSWQLNYVTLASTFTLIALGAGKYSLDYLLLVTYGL